MAKVHKMRLAGREYVLRFRSRDRAAIEKATGRNMADCFTSGHIEDHATIIWGGLLHLELDPELTVENILDMIDAHNEAGGDFYGDTMKPIVTRAVMESGVLGKFDPKVIDKACGVLASVGLGAAVIPQ